jgi:lysophospholipid acyltransferase (LPLAT)-like uncharacterized protein
VTLRTGTVLVLGWLAGIVGRVWLRTLRVRVEADPALDAEDDRPWVLAFFHGALFPLLAWPRRRSTAVLVSHSNDGTVLARARALLGREVVRGSTSRGGVRGLVSLVRLLQARDRDVAFAVDGPRGPRRVAKPGATLAAQRGDARLVPLAAAVASGTVLRSWDRFVLPRPFSRVVVVLGAPLPLLTEAAPDERGGVGRANARERSAENQKELSTHIALAEARAEAILAGWERPMVRFPRFLWGLASRSSSASIHPSRNGVGSLNSGGG